MTEQEKQLKLRLLELSRTLLARIVSQGNESVRDTTSIELTGQQAYRDLVVAMRSSQARLNKTEAAIDYMNSTPAAQLTPEAVEEILERHIE